jgi:hypothetical protein
MAHGGRGGHGRGLGGRGRGGRLLARGRRRRVGVALLEEELQRELLGGLVPVGEEPALPGTECETRLPCGSKVETRAFKKIIPRN